MLRGRRDECAVLDRLLDGARAGRSGSLVLEGEAGVGKTALLEHAIASASDLRVLRAVGVESEMELAFAALHQLCAPVLDRLERLPAPQRDALLTTFGLRAGPVPDRFLVGLAVLSLLSEVADERPLVCVVDDAQWLDGASAQCVAFVARRLLAESAVILFAARGQSDLFAGLPELVVEGLRAADARSLLASAVPGRLDEGVADQLLAETRGNPLALLELPRGLTATQLAGGFGLPGALSLSGRIEESFVKRLEALPADTQRLLLAAAAEPLGDPALVGRAAERLGVTGAALAPAESAGLLEIDARVRFRHPLVRSAVYRAGAPSDRRQVHRALGEATDARVDPDRRAWHLAEAAAGPDEDVAAELERAADRAQARGGLAAAAAFHERSARLTSDPDRRAQRLLAAAGVKRGSGALDAALGLLAEVEAGPLDELGRAHAELSGGRIALEQRRGDDAGRLLASAARRLEPLDPELARETYLEALGGAMVGDLEAPGGARAVAEAARAARSGPVPPRAADVLLDAFATRLTDGYAAAAPALARGLELLLASDVTNEDVGRSLSLVSNRASAIVALELWDVEAFHLLAARRVQLARDAGALVHLRFALSFLARSQLLAGEVTAATSTIDEAQLIAEASGNLPLVNAPMILAAWRGQEERASELIEATAEEAAARRWTSNAYARSVLYNGLGRHDAARDAAREAFQLDLVGHGPFLVPELAEAASRTGDTAMLESALEWLSGRTRVVSSEWVLGIEARVHALLSEGEAAERLYRDSIVHLSGNRVRLDLARTHLLYGEWLRRERHHLDAREQLRTALEMFTNMGTDAFAARAERELLATGERVRKRTVEIHDELTPQEAQIARLASEGLSNAEIGARLFISQHTVAYHLRKVFSKLGITSRNQLDRVLPEGGVRQTT
ncbi:MAG TPA: AAA family ATPase [Solirubrobacteraceae bacterium]|nr:AAA family ATPase [Solirubrobacteraceae bacterium]